jgi:hypothetical protein
MRYDFPHFLLTFPSINPRYARVLRFFHTCAHFVLTSGGPGGAANVHPTGGCKEITPALTTALYSCLIGSFVFMCCISCCGKRGDHIRKRYPTNVSTHATFTHSGA